MRLRRIPERRAVELLALEVRLERGERRLRPRRGRFQIDAPEAAELAQQRDCDGVGRASCRERVSNCV